MRITDEEKWIAYQLIEYFHRGICFTVSSFSKDVPFKNVPDLIIKNTINAFLEEGLLQVIEEPDTLAFVCNDEEMMAYMSRLNDPMAEGGAITIDQFVNTIWKIESYSDQKAHTKDAEEDDDEDLNLDFDDDLDFGLEQHKDISKEEKYRKAERIIKEYIANYDQNCGLATLYPDGSLFELGMFSNPTDRKIYFTDKGSMNKYLYNALNELQIRGKEGFVQKLANSILNKFISDDISLALIDDTLAIEIEFNDFCEPDDDWTDNLRWFSNNLIFRLDQLLLKEKWLSDYSSSIGENISIQSKIEQYIQKTKVNSYSFTNEGSLKHIVKAFVERILEIDLLNITKEDCLYICNILRLHWQENGATKETIKIICCVEEEFRSACDEDLNQLRLRILSLQKYSGYRG